MHSNSKFINWTEFYNFQRSSKNVTEKCIDLSNIHIKNLKERFGLSDSDFSLGQTMLTYSVPKSITFGNISFNQNSIRIEIKYSGLTDIEYIQQTDGYDMHKIKIESIEGYQNQLNLIFKLSDSAFKSIKNGNYESLIRLHSAISSGESIQNIIKEDIEPTAVEGKSFLAVHMRYERNNSFIRKIKEEAIKSDPFLRCEACEFSFFENFGELGKGFIEAHHLNPLSTSKGERITTRKDIALLCSNCHKMIHRGNPVFTLEELKNIMMD